MSNQQKLLNSVTSTQRNSLALALNCSDSHTQGDAVYALYFLTAENTAALEKEAYALSSRCASILNNHRSTLNTLKQVFSTIDDALLRKQPPLIMDFLKLFCVIDPATGEARPLQPQTALARLREDPEHPIDYMRFKTHTYFSHCLLDLVSLDNLSSSMSLLYLLTEKEDNQLHSRLKSVGREHDYRPDAIATAVRNGFSARGENYDQLFFQLDGEMQALRQHAEKILASCQPAAEKQLELH